MNDSMKNLFFIVKGQYKKGAEPSFTNKVNNEVSFIGGYDPYDPSTPNWYMLMDCKTYHCIACGGNLDKILKAVYNTVMTHKGSAKKYFKHISEVTSDDYYETHYLGHRPLTTEERVNKAEGRCPRVSPVMRCMYEHIYNEFGEYYSDEVEEMVDKAYADLEEWLRENKPLNKTKKRIGKNKLRKTVTETPKKEEVTPIKKASKPKVRLGMKKIIK